MDGAEITVRTDTITVMPTRSLEGTTRHQDRLIPDTGDTIHSPSGRRSPASGFDRPAGYRSPPSWVADAIFYQVFPDRFARSGQATRREGLQAWDAPPTFDGFKGGDLPGLAERLAWIRNLGCNALYLNPVFQSPANHRYHTHDYYRIDPLLGGDRAFDHLLAECRRQGMRVILDGVFNHVGRGFFQFNHVLEAGAESPYLDWFHIHGFPLRAYDQSNGHAQYESWWGMPALPKLNTGNPEVREYLMRVGEHWIERGIDGWRLDVPQEIGTEGFWEEFRERIRTINPDAYLVGEIWDDAGWWTVGGERFDGTMNYLLTGYTVSFASGDRIDPAVAERLSYRTAPLDAAGYAHAVQGFIDAYPAHVLEAHLNLLGSHDTARILSVMGNDPAPVRLAALLMFTFPGAPCIYYGDEIGMAGGPDPGCRAGFPWDNREGWNHELLETFSSLAGLRRRSAALRRGGYWIVYAPAGGHLYAFVRERGDERLLVAVNSGNREAQATLDFPPAGRTPQQLWGAGRAEARNAAIRIRLPACQGAVWDVGKTAGIRNFR